MADVNDRELLGDVAPEGEPEPLGGAMRPPAQPFWDGNAKSLKVTKKVNPIQLLDEIEDRLGDPSRYQVVMQVDDPKTGVSTDNPLTVHVHPADTDMHAVREVVKAHTPDPDYGKSKADLEREGLVQRLRDGNDLALPELNKILRSIIG